MDGYVGDALRGALEALVDGLAPRHASQAVTRLMDNYRGPTPTHAPVLRDRADVVAYAAYRMPATFEAVRTALGATADAAGSWTPAGHLDIGGGTGAAAWAASAVWAGERPVTVLDWSAPALAVGRELATANTALKSAEWREARIGPALGSALPERGTDLVTVSYVLGELTPDDRAAVVDAAAQAASGAVVIVEPGTPDGYARVMAARERLTGAGLRIAAPCPHGGACPIEPGEDWCHFAARVGRSSLHRQVKGGSLPYEDEKFSYVAAVRLPAAQAAARVLRRPQLRKGQVLLDLCAADGTLGRRTVTKRHGAAYRAARDVAWGDAWDSEAPTAGPGR